MKLARYPEVESIRQTETVELSEGVTIRIQDLPPSYGDELESRLPSPRPPVKGLAMQGKRPLLDEDGRPLKNYDTDDPEYRAALAERQKLALVYMVTEGAVAGELVFDAQPNGDWPAYYAAVLDEMKAFGWGIGQVTKVSAAVQRLSGINEDDIAEARGGFSEPGTD